MENGENFKFIELVVNNSRIWYLDLGVTTHVCVNKALFSHLKPCNKTLNWGQISITIVNEIGIVYL